MKWMSLLADTSAVIVATIIGGAILGMCVIISVG